ncbi:MAG: hypothetical protein R3B99_24380 [Polyangiales bacterium]
MSTLSVRTCWGHVGLVALGGWMQCSSVSPAQPVAFAFVCFLPMFCARARAEREHRRVLALGLMHGFVGYSGGYLACRDALGLQRFRQTALLGDGELFFLTRACSRC